MSLLDKVAAGLRPSMETMVAAGAAAITGAAVFLMPVELLQNAVIASGLPELLPPLDPPLGNRARIGLALVAAGFAFGLVALLVRLFVGKGRPKAAKAKKAANQAETPRVRRRDRHPDAPPRAPLSVGREIAALDGEPAAPRMPRGDIAAEAAPEDEARSLPRFLDRAPATTQAAPPPANARPPIFAAEPPALFEQAAEAPETPVVRGPVGTLDLDTPVELPTEIPTRMAAAEPKPEPEPEPAPQPVTTHPAWLDASPAEPVARSEPTLAELLERLEAAMARPRPTGDAATQIPDDPAPAVPTATRDDADDRLRSALENLKRFAPRRG